GGPVRALGRGDGGAHARRGRGRTARSERGHVATAARTHVNEEADMEATELLATRASNGKLGEPAPDDATLHAILEAALRAPDHAALRPWRIFVVRGQAREKLGDLFAEIEDGDE